MEVYSIPGRLLDFTIKTLFLLQRFLNVVTVP
jgi:hypothetical protein